MNKYKNPTRLKFEGKCLLYAVSLVSVSLGLSNEYVKRKRLKYKDEEHKIYFHLNEQNFEVVDRKKYSERIKKICETFNIPIMHLAEAANNYFPVDFHLQYMNDIVEKKKKDLQKIVERESKNNNRDNVISKMVDEMVTYLEVYMSNKNEKSSNLLFLKNIDWSYLKEFLIERKKVNTKTTTEFIDTFFDEIYTYVYVYLLINYKRNNLFDFIKMKRTYRHCSENVGKDVGLEVDNYLGINKHNYSKDVLYDGEENVTQVIDDATYVLNIDTVNEIQKSLSNYGIVVLKNFLPIEKVEKIKKELFLHKNEMNISPFLMNKDQNVFCIRPTRGRQYCILRNSKISDIFTNIQQYWVNIVYSYLPIGIYQNVFHSFDKNKILHLNNFSNLNLTSEQNDKLYLSELQLLTNEPLSETQTYHVDNGLSGLTVILPLNKIHEQSGNFEFFIGTHLFSSLKNKNKIKDRICNLKKFVQMYYKTGSSFVPEVEERDIIIYDSKILHRGLSNNLWVKNASLIYRYDYKKYPPPGQDFIDILSYNFVGKCISIFNFLGKYF
ncbi:conserved Plasmodium protein, unknown function [Plasmodium ovale]|uniref:Phytanoyl-CoA dioxygenase n=1 Tax=Plasmodium ovale TaxID=36330 RepID=A0A1D3U914_PLAOA|nr:conserved Plasmodium protein, unknown function [Plasmodium ovale]